MLFLIHDEASQSGGKILVFSQRIKTIDYLTHICKSNGRRFYRLDGSTKISDRQRQVFEFNKDRDSLVYFISTKAGGTGLNLQWASRVVIFDFKYAPTIEEQQRIGRAYRVGQTRPVFVYWLTVASTCHVEGWGRDYYSIRPVVQ